MVKKKVTELPYQLGKFSAIRNSAFSFATSANVLELSCQRASWQDGKFQTVLRTLKSSAWKKRLWKKYQKQVRKLYLLWSEKLHFQGKSSPCGPPAWWCEGPEWWETRHSGKNSVKMYYEWINSFNIGVSSPNQPFVLIEFPYEYSGSQLLQLKNVTVQWVTGTWVSVLKKGKSNVRAA